MPNTPQLQLLNDRTAVPPTPVLDPVADKDDVPQGRKILIVDDSHFERSVIRSAVEALTKFRVCGEASDGVEAIKKARELRPDLVIMDLAMPLMNGVEAAMVLRNAMPETPIVLFTLYAEQLRGAISPGFGVRLIVSKTDGLAPLIESLERLLAA
jgi:two-component system nitrate/nitrite response regulator NarL